MSRNFLSRLLSRSSSRTTRSRPQTETRAARPSTIEGLENRLFMHTGPLQVSSVVADNRGEMLIIMNQAIRASNVNTGAIQMYTAGPDGILANADDTRVTTMLNYQTTGNRIVIRSELPAGTGYRVKLVSERIETPDGDVSLDGEFNGTFPSGNGSQLPGGTKDGNFEFQVKLDKSATPTVRMSTTDGVITLRMRGDAAPRTVNNFLQYANDGQFDNMFFTRSEPNFVIQGGSLRINDENEVIEGTLRPGIANETNLLNARGTLAMAKSDLPNSATNQFFFNLGNNTGLDQPNASASGPFTVFAQVTNASGLAVMDAIAARPRVDLTGQIGPFPSTIINTVPVRDTAAETNLDPQEHLIVVRRTASLMRVVRL